MLEWNSPSLGCSLLCGEKEGFHIIFANLISDITTVMEQMRG